MLKKPTKKSSGANVFKLCIMEVVLVCIIGSIKINNKGYLIINKLNLLKELITIAMKVENFKQFVLNSFPANKKFTKKSNL